MHALHEYMTQQMRDHLQARRVVVFYDPRREFEPFLEELPGAGAGVTGLPLVRVRDLTAHLARYEGSFFALRAMLEPLVAADRPEPTLVYIPGVERDRTWSPLTEIEKAGTCYEPQLRRMARRVLETIYSPAQIDELLAPEGIGWADVAKLCESGSPGPSLLHLIFGHTPDDQLLATWLADATLDDAIEAKGATAELRRKVKESLGLYALKPVDSAALRQQAARYVLVNEFRADLTSEPPASIGQVPMPPEPAHAGRIADVARLLRDRHSEAYVALADHVEAEMMLVADDLDPTGLGRTDTFRFEERRLLGLANDRIAGGRLPEARPVVEQRARSFWVDRDPTRRAQWQACQRMVELGEAIHRVREAMDTEPGDARAWVEAYTTSDGWHEVDRRRRLLEASIVGMGEEPDGEEALAHLRHAHEDLLRQMAERFGSALRSGGWTVPGFLPQRRVYAEFVRVSQARTAFVLVDAMRYEMGVDLAKQLGDAAQVEVHPVIAQLPTITTVGMAALLPDADTSFGVTDAAGVAARIGEARLPGLTERQAYLRERVPGVVDLRLEEVLSRSAGKLEKTLSGASFIVVRSQEIDLAGELGGGYLARQVMDTVIGNVARAVRKLSRAGVEAFVITADHGHQFSLRKDEDMRIDAPGGETVELHRRCWIGRGGSNPGGTVRVKGAELGYGTDLDFVFPSGLGVFKACGGLTYHHGGFSLQELVIPVVVAQLAPPAAPAPSGSKVTLSGVGQAVTNRVLGVRVRLQGDMFVTDPLPVRVALISGGQQIGLAGMADGAELDAATGIVRLPPNVDVNVGLLLLRADVKALRVVVLDPTSDAVLAQTAELPVQLGI